MQHSLTLHSRQRTRGRKLRHLAFVILRSGLIIYVRAADLFCGLAKYLTSTVVSNMTGVPPASLTICSAIGRKVWGN